jgi:hypothetical protein
MAVPTGRSDKRIPKEVVVELALSDASQLKEAAVAQNVSARGMRAATEPRNKSGAQASACY